MPMCSDGHPYISAQLSLQSPRWPCTSLTFVILTYWPGPNILTFNCLIQKFSTKTGPHENGNTTMHTNSSGHSHPTGSYIAGFFCCSGRMCSRPAKKALSVKNTKWTHTWAYTQLNLTQRTQTILRKFLFFTPILKVVAVFGTVM